MSRRIIAGSMALVATLAMPVVAGAATTPIPVGPTSLTRIPVTVSPATIHPATGVVVRFRQPRTTDQRMTESVRVTGPSRTGCVGSVRAVLASAGAGTQMRRTLRPDATGRWCTGVYHGLVELSSDPVCPPGPVQATRANIVACPQFMVLPQTVATFRFRVVAG